MAITWYDPLVDIVRSGLHTSENALLGSWVLNMQVLKRPHGCLNLDNVYIQKLGLSYILDCKPWL